MKARAGATARSAPPALGLVGVGLIVLFVSLGLATSQAASASPDSPRRATCRGPASLGGFVRLTDHRKIAGKRTNCATARKVVRRFPRSCSKAYAGQGSCRVRASGRWRCRSRLAGSLADGAPSKEKCRHRRSRLKFEVAYIPRPFEPGSFHTASVSGSPYDESGGCVDTSEPGTVIPPPDLAVGSWEIHLLGRVRRGVGEDLQSALVAHRVAAVLHAGLGSQPRNYPNRIPILLTPGYLNRRGTRAVRAPTCENESLDGIVVSTREPALIAMLAAHELFHAYSVGLNPARGRTWWEEAAATWSTGRAGFPEVTLPDIDINLQYPEPLDNTRPPTYPYAMSRFVQFLDDRGFIGDPTWPLQRQVVDGYVDPGATAALATAIKDRASTLGAELAAFWGDRLRENPLHGPQLRPTARNANLIRVRPGTREVTAKADRLDANVYDFTLAPDVRRVEFEFDPPAEDGFFWGLVRPDESRPFGEGDSVSFCVGGGDEDDLEWPGNFPVAFTNGALGIRTITGTITVRAQTSAEQCTNPLLNRACRLLDRAQVQAMVGRPATFDGAEVFIGRRIKSWSCRYDQLEEPFEIVGLTVTRRQRGSQARRAIHGLIEEAEYHRIDIGDVAGIRTIDDPEFPSSSAVVVAVGREWFIITAYFRAKAITLARRVARELD